MRAILAWAAAAAGSAAALNYTGETALLDAAPVDPSRQRATTVTFGELGVFDFCGDGRARVALELGAFSSEKGSAKQQQEAAAGLMGGQDIPAFGVSETRPVRDTDPVELDHVYLIFARSRAVNNFVARLYSGSGSGGGGDAAMMCSDVGSWLESEFIAPISSLRRPPSKKQKEEEEEQQQHAGGSSSAAETGGSATGTEEGARPKISFISATAPTLGPDLLPRVTRVTGLQRRQAATSTSDAAGATPSVDKPLLSNETKANDVFLVEYEWEQLVPHGGEYAVVIANCAGAAIQFKYNLIMANRWRDGQWTNLPAGWMPVQQVYPAVCYTLWGVAVAAWAAMQAHQARRGGGRPTVGIVLGFVPMLRFMGCLADQSRYKLWGAGSYEVTMVVVSTSLVDALADGAHFLVVLALAKGWGVVRARLAGTEKRLVPGLVGFVAIATLYDGATRGGGVLAVGVLQTIAVAYTCASLAHTRRVHAVQTLRLVSRNEAALVDWWRECSAAPSPPLPAVALRQLARRGWRQIEAACGAHQQQRRNALALVWSAARKERLLQLLHCIALPFQALDIAVLVVGAFAVPPHIAYVALLLAQAAHWLAFMALFAVIASGGLELPAVSLPPLPAIATRRSIPVAPPNAASTTPRPLPPLGRLRLLRSAAPFAASARNRASSP